MTLQSRFQSVDSAPDPSFFVRYVDRLSSHPEVIRSRKIGLDFVGDAASGQLVEIGCGAGDVCSQMASTHHDCNVIGVDKSSKMLEECRRRHGGISNLEFKEGSFDELRRLRARVIWVERVLVHLEDPGNAIGTAVRSLESNGKVVVIEPDWGTLVVTGVDPGLIGPWAQDITNVQLSGTVGRQLPLLFRRHSVALEGHEIAFLPFESRADLNDLINLDRTISSAATREVISPMEGVELTRQFIEADERKELVGFVALVIALGRKSS